MTNDTSVRDCDVVIAGGGMIGTSLALALSTLDLDIVVVEPVARGDHGQPSFDDRSTALSRSSQRMFAALGLWERIAAASTPVSRINVSERGRFGFAHIDADEQGVDALGHVVINRVLGEVLDEALHGAPGLTLECPARIVATRRLKDGLRGVETADGDGSRRLLGCRLLVAADGARSGVRGMLGIGAEHSSYRQRAIIGNVVTARPIGTQAYERFTADGPLAVLPIQGGRAAFVWILPDAAAEGVLRLDDDAFLERLQDAFGNRLGEMSRVGSRQAYPLSLSRAERLVAERAALVGNAANGLHPVAAQGFNLGLRDVAALAECIADAVERGDGDVGSEPILERYARWRHADQRNLVRFTDGLVKLFGSRRPPVRLLRSLGMLGFDLVPGVRRLFARHTMGLTGRLPRLSRGLPLT